MSSVQSWKVCLPRGILEGAVRPLQGGTARYQEGLRPGEGHWHEACHSHQGTTARKPRTVRKRWPDPQEQGRMWGLNHIRWQAGHWPVFSHLVSSTYGLPAAHWWKCAHGHLSAPLKGRNRWSAFPKRAGVLQDCHEQRDSLPEQEGPRTGKSPACLKHLWWTIVRQAMGNSGAWQSIARIQLLVHSSLTVWPWARAFRLWASISTSIKWKSLH